jgi:hypothetical protein
MPKNIHKRHGENIHKLEEIPEKPVLAKNPDLLTSSRDNISPAQIKYITQNSKGTKQKTNKTNLATQKPPKKT